MVLLRTKVFVLCSIACFAFGIAGCEKGIAEKTGQEIDKAVDSAEETTHDAAKIIGSFSQNITVNY